MVLTIENKRKAAMADSKLTDDFRLMMARLRVSIEKEVEGDWYIFENNGHPAFVERVKDGWVGEDGYSIAWYIQEDWIITPVIIFRKS